MTSPTYNPAIFSPDNNVVVAGSPPDLDANFQIEYMPVMGAVWVRRVGKDTITPDGQLGILQALATYYSGLAAGTTIDTAGHPLVHVDAISVLAYAVPADAATLADSIKSALTATGAVHRTDQPLFEPAAPISAGVPVLS